MLKSADDNNEASSLIGTKVPALLTSQQSKISTLSSPQNQLTNQAGGVGSDNQDIEKAARSNSNDSEDDQLLMLAIKDAQFIQPDLSLFTMRFHSDEESAFQAYLMGMNTSTPATHRPSPPQPTASTTSSNHHNHTTAPPKSSKFSNSLRIWAHPQNMLFVSVLLAVCVNLCLSTAYFLTFIVASMSAIQYKLTDVYQRDFLVVLALFALVCLVQFGFLFLNFWTCNKAIKKRQQRNVHESNSAHEFSENLLQNNNSKPHTSGGDAFNSNNNNNNYMSYHQSTKIEQQRRIRRRVLIRFGLLHATSFVLLSLVPIYILSTALSSPLDAMLSHSWSSMFGSTSSNSQSSMTTTTSSVSTPTTSKRLNLFALYIYFCFTVALLHFSSFVQLSALFKTLIALVFALLFAMFGFFGVSNNYFSQNQISQVLNTTTTRAVGINRANVASSTTTSLSFSFYTTDFIRDFRAANVPILIDMILLILLIWLVNRHLESTQRLSFRNDKTAQAKITYAREQKELASWLIEVVLPAHVVSHVKEKKQYSRNYDCVGVLFVSLCNFSEFFEETFEGGRELLRVLNEITVDFDGLLDEPKYRNVEKIKSIGSTFMIASGLCADDTDADADEQMAHLHELIEFALELYTILDKFNNEAMAVCHFKFQMRMGFNCGPVTAGVIGTERLLYDIWGNTVNVASRMDSTGQAGFIQCPERVAQMLADDYKFERRGAIQVKGIDQMITYFMDPKMNAPKRSPESGQ